MGFYDWSKYATMKYHRSIIGSTVRVWLSYKNYGLEVYFPEGVTRKFQAQKIKKARKDLIIQAEDKIHEINARREAVKNLDR